MQTDSPTTRAQSAPEDFALMRGGPLFRLAQRFHLDHPDRPVLETEERLLLAWVIGWVPLFLLCFVVGNGEAFLAGRRLQAEFLFALPVLFAGENYVNGRVADAAQRPLLLRLLLPADEVRYRAVLDFAAKRRDSRIAELAMILLAYFLTLLEFRIARVPPPLLRGSALSAAGFWYFLIAHPLLWFLLLRWSWRFLIWWDVLNHLAQFNLQLVATHADRAGGLRYLAKCQASFSVVVFSAGVLVEALTQTSQATLSTKGLLEYARGQVLYALLALVIVNLPLLHFSRKMLNANRRSDREFSALMAQHGRDFERKWFGTPRESPLGSEDMSTQTDITTAYQAAGQMWWFPFGFRSAVAVLASGLLLPLVPRLLVDRQLLNALLMFVPKL